VLLPRGALPVLMRHAVELRELLLSRPGRGLAVSQLEGLGSLARLRLLVSRAALRSVVMCL
jgi:hypothetical protein